MRIIYDNQLDDLVASQITALTAETLYAATRVTDERLTVQWETTSPTAQTIIFNAGGAEEPMFVATTNLVVDPENLTSANWTETNVAVTTAESILGIPAYKVTCNATNSSSYAEQDVSFGSTSQSILFIARRGNVNAISIRLVQTSGTPANKGYIDVTSFSAKTVVVYAGTKTLEEWIDDDTVRLGLAFDVDTGETNALRLYAPGSTVGNFTYYSNIAAFDNDYPLGYVATSRSAWITSGSTTHTVPPSGKFIVDLEVKPYFPHDLSNATPAVFASWGVSSSQRLYFEYTPSADKITVVWQDGGTFRTISSAVFNGSSRTTLQSMRLVWSLDLTQAVTTGSRFIEILRDAETVSEATAWSGAIDVLSTNMTLFYIGNYAPGPSSAFCPDAMFKYFRVYGGTLEDTITTEADLDNELATKELTFEQEYQARFNANTFAILGHNISSEASIKFETNDWDEWNFIDGSGSSITQNTMTWNEETILTFWSAKARKQYVKFTINDPNNDDAKLKIGRMWVGDYITISPSSLLNFSVTKQRSDAVRYGRNRQKFADVGTGWRRFNLSFPRMAHGSTMATIDQVERMYDDVGLHSSIIFCNFDTDRDYSLVEPCYCSISQPVGFTHQRSQKYSFSLVLEENK